MVAQHVKLMTSLNNVTSGNPSLAVGHHWMQVKWELMVGKLPEVKLQQLVVEVIHYTNVFSCRIIWWFR